MDDKALFLKVFQQEAKATRNVITRIPEGSSYKPDPKSRTAREIAWLIVREETVLTNGLEKGVLEWEEIPAPATVLAYGERAGSNGGSDRCGLCRALSIWITANDNDTTTSAESR